MLQILTVTLNPAVDIAARVEKITPNVKLRCTDPALDPGGGGVNVSRALRFLGHSSEAFVATGGAMGRLLSELLEQEGITPIAFETEGCTRQSFSVSETAGGDQFRYVLPGPDWNVALADQARQSISQLVGPDTLVVASGSLPPGVDHGFYRNLNKDLLAANGRMILDTSGKALKASVQNDQPYYLLRMDQEEAEQLAGNSFSDARELAEFAQSLIARNVATQMILALGAKGSVGVAANDIFFCKPPHVEVDSTVGAGDSLVAATSLSLARGDTFREAVAFGTAAAASAVTTPASRLCEKQTTESLRAQIQTTGI